MVPRADHVILTMSNGELDESHMTEAWRHRLDGNADNVFLDGAVIDAAMICTS